MWDVSGIPGRVSGWGLASVLCMLNLCPAALSEAGTHFHGPVSKRDSALLWEQRLINGSVTKPSCSKRGNSPAIWSHVLVYYLRLSDKFPRSCCTLLCTVLCVGLYGLNPHGVFVNDLWRYVLWGKCVYWLVFDSHYRDLMSPRLYNEVPVQYWVLMHLHHKTSFWLFLSILLHFKSLWTSERQSWWHSHMGFKRDP